MFCVGGGWVGGGGWLEVGGSWVGRSVGRSVGCAVLWGWGEFVRTGKVSGCAVAQLWRVNGSTRSTDRYLASMLGLTDVVAALIEARADIHIRSSADATPLFVACQEVREQVLIVGCWQRRGPPHPHLPPSPSPLTPYYFCCCRVILQVA